MTTKQHMESPSRQRIIVEISSGINGWDAACEITCDPEIDMNAPAKNGATAALVAIMKALADIASKKRKEEGEESTPKDRSPT